MESTDLLNKNTDLDGVSQFLGEEKSNFQLFGVGKPSAKQIARRGKKDVTQQITGCVAPKKLQQIGGVLTGNLGMAVKYKKDLKAYKACLNNYKAKTQAEAEAQAQSKAQIEADLKIAQDKIESLGTDKTTTDTANTTDDDTIMGIPKVGFYIGLGVLVLVGGFITYKMIKK